MSLRLATDADISELAVAYISAFADVDPSERWTVERAADFMRFFLRVQLDLAFVAEEDGQIAGGMCGVVKPWWDGNHLVESELFLKPQFQKRGIGSKLFTHLLREAQDRYQVTEIESVTFRALEFPLSWYLEIGFERKDDWQVITADVACLLDGLESQ